MSLCGPSLLLWLGLELSYFIAAFACVWLCMHLCLWEEGGEGLERQHLETLSPTLRGTYRAARRVS